MFEKSKQLFIAQWIYQQFFGKIIFAEQNEIYCLFITEKRANLNVHLSPPPPKLGTCQKLGNQHPEPPSFFRVLELGTPYLTPVEHENAI